MAHQADNVIGFDLNDQYCQISYCHEGMEEPVTREVLADNYKIPLAIGTYRSRWTYGQEAIRYGLGGRRSSVRLRSLRNSSNWP